MSISSVMLDSSDLSARFHVRVECKSSLKEGGKSLSVFLNFVSNSNYWKREAEKYSTRDMGLADKVTHPLEYLSKKASEVQALANIEEWTELVLDRENHVKYRIRLDLEPGERIVGFNASKFSLLQFYDLISRLPPNQLIGKQTPAMSSARNWKTFLNGDEFRIYLTHVSNAPASQKCIDLCQERVQEWESFCQALQKNTSTPSKVEREVSSALLKIAELKKKEVAAMRQKVSASPKEWLQMEVKRVQAVSSSIGGGAVTGGLFGGITFGPPGALVGAFFGGLLGAAGGSVMHEKLVETRILPSEGLDHSRIMAGKAIPYCEEGGAAWDLKEVLPIEPSLALELGMEGEKRLMKIVGTGEYVWVSQEAQISRWDRADLVSLREINMLEMDITIVRQNPHYIYEHQKVDIFKIIKFDNYKTVIYRVAKPVNPDREIAIYEQLAKEWASHGKLFSKKVRELREKKASLLHQPEKHDHFMFEILNESGERIRSLEFDSYDILDSFLSKYTVIDEQSKINFYDVEVIDEFKKEVQINGLKTQIQLAKIILFDTFVWVLEDEASSTNTWILVEPSMEQKIRVLESAKPIERGAYFSRMQVNFSETNGRTNPTGIRYPSKWDSREFLDDDRASLTILSVCGGTRYDPLSRIAGHAVLCYEGVKNGLPYIRYAHLTTKRNVVIDEDIVEDKDRIPLWVWELKNNKNRFEIRIRSKAYYVNSRDVDQMDRRIRDHKKDKVISFNMFAPWKDSYPAYYKNQLERTQGQSTESCITYAAWMARGVIPELPEPSQLNPDEYIKQLDGAVTFR